MKEEEEEGWRGRRRTGNVRPGEALLTQANPE